jgi:predicted nucleotidyltransferase
MAAAAISDTSSEATFLATIAAAFAVVPGVRAVVLGGSRVTGTADALSDYDIGLYYRSEPIDITALRSAVAELEGDLRADAVTEIGEWGPWVNGGGWLAIDGRRVDLLYRDLSKVRAVVEDCARGIVTRDYQPGHPHAFVSAIYCGEVAESQPLIDPAAAVADLKRLALPYPAALGPALIRTFLWEIDFALANAGKSAKRGDVTYVAGCAFRAVACLCQVLFARNRQYLLNEKGAVGRIESLARRPADCRRRIEAALAKIGSGEMVAALGDLQGLAAETAALAAE